MAGCRPLACPADPLGHRCSPDTGAAVGQVRVLALRWPAGAATASLPGLGESRGLESVSLGEEGGVGLPDCAACSWLQLGPGSCRQIGSSEAARWPAAVRAAGIMEGGGLPQRPQPGSSPPPPASTAGGGPEQPPPPATKTAEVGASPTQPNPPQPPRCRRLLHCWASNWAATNPHLARGCLQDGDGGARGKHLLSVLRDLRDWLPAVAIVLGGVLWLTGISSKIDALGVKVDALQVRCRRGCLPLGAGT